MVSGARLDPPRELRRDESPRRASLPRAGLGGGAVRQAGGSSPFVSRRSEVKTRSAFGRDESPRKGFASLFTRWRRRPRGGMRFRRGNRGGGRGTSSGEEGETTSPTPSLQITRRCARCCVLGLSTWPSGNAEPHRIRAKVLFTRHGPRGMSWLPLVRVWGARRVYLFLYTYIV